MKAFRLPLILSALVVVAPAAFASPELAQKRSCMACHAIDKKLVGPAFKDIAAKYAADKEAPAKLATKIQKGGVGSWGQIPMPANPAVTDAEAKELVAWVLKQK